MNKTNMKDRVMALEAEVKFIKERAIGNPDFSIDSTNWKKVVPSLKRARTSTYKKVYG